MFGKIDLKVKNNRLFLSDDLCKKNSLNIAVSLDDINKVQSFIESNNNYIIHYINIIYDSRPSVVPNIKLNYVYYYKTIIIDNCGNVYVLSDAYHESNLKIFADELIKIKYPEQLLTKKLPNFIITYIKNIHANFVFRTIDYSDSIIKILENISIFSDVYHTITQESTKYMQIINQKNDMMINLIDVEIVDYKKKHTAEIQSLTDIIGFLENENILNVNLINDMTSKHTQVTNELRRYNRNIIIWLVVNFWSLVDEFIKNLLYLDRYED